MPNDVMYLSDKEVAKVFGVSESTLRHAVKNGPGKGRDDVRRVKRLTIGGMRRWDLVSLAEFTGRTADDIIATARR